MDREKLFSSVQLRKRKLRKLQPLHNNVDPCFVAMAPIGAEKVKTPFTV
jgi:hypothetical protein